LKPLLKRKSKAGIKNGNPKPESKTGKTSNKNRIKHFSGRKIKKELKRKNKKAWK